jgi:23S rRNA pseudouridine955/2504/2580 synthase
VATTDKRAKRRATRASVEGSARAGSGDRADASKLLSISILFEDDFLVAVSKPPGMAVHGGAGGGRTVIELLEAAYPNPRRLHLVHRIDAATSGLLLLAKSPQVTRAAGAIWDRFQKTYLALALGSIGDTTIDRALPDDEGKLESARTKVRSLLALPECTLVSATIETGRTHQIRRHLALAGHPILMDDKHGDFAANKRWSRAVREAGGPRPKHLMLHAHRLTGPHPMTGESVALCADPPAFWREILAASGARVDALHLLS